MSNRKSSRRPDTLFWVISYVSLLSALLGFIACFSEILSIDSIREMLPVAERDLYQYASSWILVVYGFTVIANVAGSVFLLKQKGIAVAFFNSSFVGIAILMYYNFFTSKSSEIYDLLEMFIPITIILIGGFMPWYSSKVKKKGWLHSLHHTRRKRYKKRKRV